MSYVKSTRPGRHGSTVAEPPPDQVFTRIYVEDIFSVATQGTFHLFMIITQVWQDYRLQLEGQYPGYDYAQITESDIWLPTVTLNKLIDKELIKSSSIITRNSTLVRTTMYNVDLGCTFDYEWLPFDFQECSIDLVSKFPVHEVLQVPVKFDLDDRIEIPEWDIIDDDFEKETELESVGLYVQTHSLVSASFVIKRRIDYYLRFVFIPTIFLVFISYSSFFISHLAYPARTNLGVIPILTSFGQLGVHMSQMPKFQYESWLITFLFTNTCFNVIAMLEFSFVAYMEQHYGQFAKQATPKVNADKGGIGPLLAAPPPVIDMDQKDKTCPCFKALFKGKGNKQRVGAYQKVCRYFYRCVRSYFVASPKVIDKLFRLLFLMAYLMVLFVLFLLPLQHTYPE